MSETERENENIILYKVKYIFIVNVKNGAMPYLPYKIQEPNENGEGNDIDKSKVE